MKHGFLTTLALLLAFSFIDLSTYAQTTASVRPFQVSITVSDLGKSIAWYKEMLGFELIEKFNVTQQKTKTAILELNDFYLELVQKENTCSRNLIKIPDDAEICGFFKAGFRVTDFEDYHQQVKQLHPEQVTDIITSEINGSVYFYMADPDQITIQIFPSPNTKDPMRIKPYLIGIIVDNIEPEIEWYEQNLGYAFTQKWDVTADNQYVRLLVSGPFVVELRQEKINHLHPEGLHLPEGKTTLLGIHKMTFRVDNILTYSETLRENNTPLLQEITKRPAGRYTAFLEIEDPEKNPIQIIQ
ncbi:MAG: VOC family protein [Lentimicrobiaceae bacterium]|nr:VOC family protein [Lentimicrobiaceae bacterium]